jgi:hypothetical protein
LEHLITSLEISKMSLDHLMMSLEYKFMPLTP